MPSSVNVNQNYGTCETVCAYAIEFGISAGFGALVGAATAVTALGGALFSFVDSGAKTACSYILNADYPETAKKVVQFVILNGFPVIAAIFATNLAGFSIGLGSIVAILVLKNVGFMSLYYLQDAQRAAKLKKA